MAQEIIAIIGAGGKTTALKLLAKQSGKSSVLVTTTTHIYPMEEFLCLRDPSTADLARPGILCAGSSAKEGKLGALPREVLNAAMENADLVVYEADGAHFRPLKLHKEAEPVILPQTTHCLIVAGLSALGKPMEEAVHRYALQSSWKAGQTVAIEELIYCVQETAAASGLPFSKIKVFLNQADTLGNATAAIDAAKALRAAGLDTRYGSLQEEPNDLYCWVTEAKCP